MMAGPFMTRGEAVGAALGTVVVTLYFFQSATLGPNHTDEGLILQYIDDMARGRLPFYDFVDAYGLMNWVFPVTFYKAFGDRVWGVRVWMVLLKVLTVVTAYLLVRRLTAEPVPTASPGDPAADGAATPAPRSPGERPGILYAALSCVWVTVLLGAKWQSLQTAYAFLTVMPLVLGTWHVLVVGPLGTERRNALFAGVLTTITMWTKLNTGMFLLAGGLFFYFYFPRTLATPAPTEAEEARRALLLRHARNLGLIAYGMLFGAFMRQYFSFWFFVYLLIPLVLALGFASYVGSRLEQEQAPRTSLAPFFTYLATSVGLSLLVLFGYYGARAGEYAAELAGILSSIKYTAPFPRLGMKGPYVGLNEFFWLQIPWAVTLTFAAWTALEPHGRALVGRDWATRRAAVGGLFLLLSLHTFCIYARADETHIYQALVVAVPVLFVLVGQLDGFLGKRSRGGQRVLRVTATAFALWYSHSLFVVPEASAFALDRGEWQNPKLAHIQYRGRGGRYVREFTPDISDREWDIIEDDAAAYVKSISLPDEDALLLTANRLFYLNSDTRPIGGRWHFYFYLASVGLLDRRGFNGLVPPEVIKDIIARPPRVIASAYGYVPLALVFPELARLRDEHYERTREFRHIWIYELRKDGRPVPAPLR